jgi:membrane associated rhomboid family serine protease
MVYYKINNSRNGLLRWLSSLSMVSWIILVNVIVFIIEALWVALSCNGATCKTLEYFALSAANIFQGKSLWTIITHMFSHVMFFHLLVNMFALFSIGSLTEKIIGRKRFIWFYVISGIFAGLLSVLLAGFFGYGFFERVFGSPDALMIGASGAIFAIAGLVAVLLPKLKFGIIFVPFFSLPAYIMIPGVLFVIWALSIMFSWPVGNVAHFGGLIAGVIYGSYLKLKYKKKVIVLQRMFR